MNDKELLEYAAKAAGIELGEWAGEVTKADGFPWNPLTDDGDALRLAVKLGMDLVTGVGKTLVYLKGENFSEYHGSDLYAATRRAIVRAAAEIGREM